MIRTRILIRDRELHVLEKLIHQADLGKELLGLVTGRSTGFELLQQSVEMLAEPNIDRLTLVYPESFHFEWLIRVSGNFLVKYKAMNRSIPQRTGPFKILYSGILVLQEQTTQFKNERVQMVESL